MLIGWTITDNIAGGYMKTNVLCLLKNMDKKDVELQLALQCAPVITGIKVSNLFIIDKNKEKERSHRYSKQ